MNVGQHPSDTLLLDFAALGREPWTTKLTHEQTDSVGVHISNCEECLAKLWEIEMPVGSSRSTHPGASPPEPPMAPGRHDSESDDEIYSEHACCYADNPRLGLPHELRDLAHADAVRDRIWTMVQDRFRNEQARFELQSALRELLGQLKQLQDCSIRSWKEFRDRLFDRLSGAAAGSALESASVELLPATAGTGSQGVTIQTPSGSISVVYRQQDATGQYCVRVTPRHANLTVVRPEQSSADIAGGIVVISKQRLSQLMPDSWTLAMKPNPEPTEL